MRLIYTWLTRLAAPALRLHLRRRARAGKEDPARLPEREGIDPTPRPAGKLLWLHAASVGESLSILPVIAALPPGWYTLLTTGTRSSAAILAERLAAPAFAGRVTHRFVPLDVPAWAARFLDHWRPDRAAFVESEIWPNLIAGCTARGIPIALINARLSPRSFARWRRLPAAARAVFGAFAWVAAQAQGDADRLTALGAPHVFHAGNLKFAAPLPPEDADFPRLHALIGPRKVWLAASTHEGEEAITLALHARLAQRHPGLLTIIVPRHAPRGAAIAALVTPPIPRHSLGQDPPPGGIWLGDTMGRMGLYYRLAGAVVMGKSLLPPGGGQNPLEPARLGRPVAIGPYFGNFTDMVRELHAASALHIAADETALAQWLDETLRSPPSIPPLPEAEATLPARLAARLTE